MAERGRAPGRVQGIAETWPPRGQVQTGDFTAGFGAWTRAFDKLREWVRAEAGAGRLLPWVPVAFGTGIAFYFAADHEPVLTVAAVTAAGLCVVAFLLRRHKVFPFAVMVASMAAGFATATWKTARIAHEVLAKPAYSVSLSGFVEARDIRERTDRFVLRGAQIDGSRLRTRLERVRLSVRKGTAPAVGSFVEMKARLQPPLAPLRPGSYDFSRDLFFQGIGASGFVTGSIKARDPPAAGGFSLRYAAFMQDLRDGIDARIRATRDGDKRAIATALLTGRRDAITTPVNDAMFISGLGHVLSISGYHMAVVAGAVLPVAVRCGSRDAALVLHDRGGADRRDGRSPRGDVPHARGRGDDRAGAGAGGAGASEFSDVFCGDARPRGAGADRHAASVRLAGSRHHG